MVNLEKPEKVEHTRNMSRATPSTMAEEVVANRVSQFGILKRKSS
jgi:hypothetical protein